MMVTPLARGLLGWDPNAPRGRALLAPQPHPEWEGFSVENLRVGKTRIRLKYRRDGEVVEVEMESQGPEVELTYIQGIPLGAQNIVMEGDPEGGRGRQEAGRHDIQHQLTFTLSERSSVQLRFEWDGGLEVYRGVDEELAVGSSSRGPRILDFTREGEVRLLTVEGEGGKEETVFLRGEAVETEGGRITRLGERGKSILEIPFPDSGPRVVRTIRLRPAR